MGGPAPRDPGGPQVTREARDPNAPREHSVVDGKLLKLSVSQITTFDPDQFGGCNRKWWLDKVKHLPQPQTGAQAQGVEGHGQIEGSLKAGANQLGEIARAGMHFIPFTNAPEMLAQGLYQVEAAFGEKAKDGTLNRDLTAAGIPLVGFIDFVNLSDVYLTNEGEARPMAQGTVEIEDWKFTSNVNAYGKQAVDLIKTVQMPGYGEYVLRRWPGAVDQLRFSHGYFQTRGKRFARKETILVPAEVVRERWNKIEATARSMVDVAKETDALKVEANRRACDAWRGCPYRYTCPRSAEETLVLIAGGKGMGLLDRIKQQASGEAAPAAPPNNATQVPHTACPLCTQAIKFDAAGDVVDHVDRTGGSCVAGGDTLEAATAFAARRAEKIAQRAAATEAAVAAERAALLAAETAAKAPPVTVTGAAVQRLVPDAPVGSGYMTDARTAAGILPPDAPASVAPGNAQPVPQESMATLPPAVAAAAQGHANLVPGAPPAPAAPAVAAAPAETPKTRRTRGPGRKTSVGVDTVGGVVGAVLDALDDPEGIHLYVDAIFEEGILTGEFKPLDGYIDGICAELAKAANAADVRCAPQESFLGFGKWKGALDAAIRSAPPPNGFYYLHHVNESEIKQVAVQALRGLCRTLVRGLR